MTIGILKKYYHSSIFGSIIINDVDLMTKWEKEILEHVELTDKLRNSHHFTVIQPLKSGKTPFIPYYDITTLSQTM